MRRRRLTVSGIVTTLVMIFLYAPIVTVVVFSVDRDPLLLSWTGFTLHWYHTAIHDPAVYTALLTSVEAACLSTVLSLAVAITAGLWFRRANARARRMFDLLTYSRIVLPEVLVALGLFALMNKLGIPLGLWAIVVGHVVFNSAYATVIIQARFSTFGMSLEHAAADLGASPWRVFRRVTMPLLRPAVLVAALLAISFSFDDVVSSLFLGGPSVQTIPVLLLGMIRLHVTPEVNAIGAGQMIITTVTFAIAGLVTVLRPTGAGEMLGFGRRAAR
jgi:ABC-type spermidine/putrescine transport system permease subunit II